MEVLQGKRVTVIGGGLSGTAAARLLLRQGAKVTLYDGSEAFDADKAIEKIGGPCRVICGAWSEGLTADTELAVISPGVPTEQAFVTELTRAGVPIWGEVELAYRFSAGKLVGITGTNGKTTTTALTGELLSQCYPEVFIVGNIGAPYTDAADRTTERSVTVAELSSFQLETVHAFCPDVSMILNITPDHLNRHHTMERYIEAKLAVTRNQTKAQMCILNAEDPILRECAERIPAQILWFSGERRLEKGLYLSDGRICYADGTTEEVVCETSELNIIGKHNYENAMAAVGAALCLSVPIEKIRAGLRAFHAVEHRIEYVATKRGVVYYNDSKGTNPDAAIRAIQAMDRPTLLIGGGYDKGSDYDDWIRAFDGKVKHLVLIGQTKEKIAEAAVRLGVPSVVLKDTFEEAFAFCRDHAEAGDAVLLSPACASWGMFDNYEQRGRIFKEHVHAIAE